jgi:hypothetical protein
VADNSVSIQFDVIGNAVKKLDDISKQIETLEKTADRGFSHSARIFDEFAGHLGAELATEGLKLLGEAAGKLFEVFVVDGIRAAIAQQEAINGLNQALNLAGQYTEQASEKFEAFAERMEKTSRFQNEAVLSAGALIETMGHLSEDGLEKATQAALDLASAMHIDLTTAARLVGKAAEGNVDAFKKYNISIRQGKNDTETFANTIQTLNSHFGGTAKSQVNTYSGSVDQLHKAFEDNLKVTGSVFTENVALIGIYNEIAKVMREFSGTLGQNKQAMKEFVGEGLILLIDSLSGIGIATDVLVRGVKIAFNTIVGAGKYVVALFSEMQSAFKGVLDVVSGISSISDAWNNFGKVAADNAKSINQSGKAIDDAIAGPAESYKQFDNVLRRLREAGVKGLQDIKDGETGIGSGFNEGRNSVQGYTKAQEDAIVAANKIVETVRANEESLYEVYDRQVDKVLEAIAITGDANNDYFKSLGELEDNHEKQHEEALAKQVQEVIEQNKILKTIDDAASQQKLADNKAFLEKIKQQEDKNSKAVTKIKGEEVKEKRDFNQLYSANEKDTLQYIGTLQQNASGTLFEIGKAASIAMATNDAYVAIQKAWAIGFPLSIPAVALVTAATFANISRIASSQPPKFANGIDSVPAGFPNDTFHAMLTSGERVVPAETNKDLTAFLTDRGGEREILASIDAKLSRQNQPIIVQIGERVILNEVRNALDSGRVLAI